MSTFTPSNRPSCWLETFTPRNPKYANMHVFRGDPKRLSANQGYPLSVGQPCITLIFSLIAPVGPANCAVSNKSVNEQYVSSGSYPTIGRCNDLLLPIAIADYRCTSTESIANKRRNSAAKKRPFQAGKRLV
jgi:hypothetical protein